jgi:hypothetical protein
MRYIIYMKWRTCQPRIEMWSYYSGNRGSLVTLVPPDLPVSDVESVSFPKLELDLWDLEKFFLLNLRGRICSLGFSSVPEFSAANW